MNYGIRKYGREVPRLDLKYSTINIYDQLKQKYKDYLRPEIFSISIIQSEETVWLESAESITTEDGFEKQTIKKIDLSFITDCIEEEEELYFSPADLIENNARKFINEFSPYSIINTTDLFHDDASHKISRKYNTFGIDK